MHLIQLFLPLTDNRGHEVPKTFFAQVTAELTERFGGITTYTRSPASGLWSPDDGSSPRRDDLVVFEVVVDTLDRTWWRQYVERTEKSLAQEKLHVRCWPVEML